MLVLMWIVFLWISNYCTRCTSPVRMWKRC